MFSTLPLVLFSLVAGTLALRSSTLPEDLHAFPKYKILFLNGSPVLNDTAQRWLAKGVDELEFVSGQKTPRESDPSFKGISGGQGDELAAVGHDGATSSPPPALQRMRLGSTEYVCLIPPPPEVPASADDVPEHPQAIQSWELLQPLEGKCLYHRQGWFSYAYCHGQHVRQFREKEPHLPLGMKSPLEDPNEPSYTLGHAPASVHHEEDSDGPVLNQVAVANRLELARGAGHRYLNLHWGDGTVCDKTGKKREIEVQFHCSMKTTDSIFFIKETKTCHYTLVIHTPRLCGQPGFKSAREDLQDTPLRCRKVVDTLEGAELSLPDFHLPFRQREPKPLPAPPVKPSPLHGGKKQSTLDGKPLDPNDPRSQLLQAALDAIFGRKQEADIPSNSPPDQQDTNQQERGGQPADGNKEGDEEQLAGTVDEETDPRSPASIDSDDDEEDIMEIELSDGEDAVRLLRILREAGYDARLPSQADEEEEGTLGNNAHDEL